jgi:glycosyltransferase involved in cell wall biosynthesis
MLYIAWFVLAFTLLQLLIALVNLIFYPKLPTGNLKERPFVSVLIPARNEEKNIGNILGDLLYQDYTEIEVIVFNDQSEDRTVEIVQEYALNDGRIRLINSDHLPQGWLGKNWACHSLSQTATGEYFFFADADVRVGSGLIDNAITYCKRFNLALISIFPKQIIKTIGEKVTVPNMNYILLSLLPLILVRKSGFSSLAAANGQFMFFDSAIYKAIRPHEKMRNRKVEDIEIARSLKAGNYKVACLVGDNRIKCRMYNNFNDAVSGFSKNVAAFFGNSVIIATLFWLMTTFGFLIVLFKLPLFYFTGYLVSFLFTRVIISIISEQSIKANLLFLIPQQLSLGIFILNAFINKNIKSFQWKGREIN